MAIRILLQCISVLCLEYLTVQKSKAVRTTLDVSETSFPSTVSRAGSSTLYESSSWRKLNGGLDGSSPASSAHAVLAREWMVASPPLAH